MAVRGLSFQFLFALACYSPLPLFLLSVVWTRGNLATAFILPSNPQFHRPPRVETKSQRRVTPDEKGGGDVASLFFDEAVIYVRAGSGGQGSSTYKKAKKSANGIPDGGSGGSGGNVVLRLDPNLNTLAGLGFQALRPNALGGAAASSKAQHLQPPSQQHRVLRFRAKDGTAGGRMYDNGRKGDDCQVLVPPGTVVQMQMEVPNQSMTTDQDASHENNDDNDDTSNAVELVELGTISESNPQLLVARGGRGGEGTATLKGKKKGATRRGPQGGERGNLKLTLKIVADIALVGVPNAGKSTFLASVTRAKPRIADYPFTTVVPNLGTWIPSQGRDLASAGTSSSAAASSVGGASNGLVLCDVPGLIEGASEGVGLGHAFLRHIERCRVILHLVDATSEDPIRDYKMVNDELKHYGSGSLFDKPQVVVINKMDTAFRGEDQDDSGGNDGNDLESKKQDLAAKMKHEMGHTRLLWVSAKEKDGVDDLMVRMASYVGKMKEEERQTQHETDQEGATPAA